MSGGNGVNKSALTLLCGSYSAAWTDRAEAAEYLHQQKASAAHSLCILSTKLTCEITCTQALRTMIESGNSTEEGKVCKKLGHLFVRTGAFQQAVSSSEHAVC